MKLRKKGRAIYCLATTQRRIRTLQPFCTAFPRHRLTMRKHYQLSMSRCSALKSDYAHSISLYRRPVLQLTLTVQLLPVNASCKNKIIFINQFVKYNCIAVLLFFLFQRFVAIFSAFRLRIHPASAAHQSLTESEHSARCYWSLPIGKAVC